MNDNIIEPVPYAAPVFENLIFAVQKELENSGLKIQSDTAFIAHPLIQQVTNEHAYVQREHLNLYFLYQLARFSSESMEERYCLVNDGTPDEWLRLFKSKILPFLISKNIPAVIH